MADNIEKAREAIKRELVETYLLRSDVFSNIPDEALRLTIDNMLTLLKLRSIREVCTLYSLDVCITLAEEHKEQIVVTTTPISAQGVLGED